MYTHSSCSSHVSYTLNLWLREKICIRTQTHFGKWHHRITFSVFPSLQPYLRNPGFASVAYYSFWERDSNKGALWWQLWKICVAIYCGGGVIYVGHHLNNTSYPLYSAFYQCPMGIIWALVKSSTIYRNSLGCHLGHRPWFQIFQTWLEAFICPISLLMKYIWMTNFA